MSCSGGHEKGELMHIQDPLRLISFFHSKPASLHGAVLVTESYLFFQFPLHGFPSPLPF